jgi:hypothetical protein
MAPASISRPGTFRQQLLDVPALVCKSHIIIVSVVSMRPTAKNQNEDRSMNFFLEAFLVCRIVIANLILDSRDPRRAGRKKGKAISERNGCRGIFEP